MLGAERGDDQAVAWLRAAAREASAQAPSVTVELVRHAEALLPDGHRDADLVASEVVAGAPARREGGRGVGPRGGGARPPARRRGGHPVAPRAARRARAPESRRRADRRRADQPRRCRAGSDPPNRCRCWPSRAGPRPTRATLVPGESAARRALAIAEQAGDAAMTVWALTALLVAVGRQGRYRRGAGPRPAGRRAGRCLARHEIAAAPSEALPRSGAVRLRPRRRGARCISSGARRRVRLGMVALRRADGGRAGVVRPRGVGGRGSRADRRRPGRSRRRTTSSWCHSRSPTGPSSATGRGDLGAATELAAGIADSLEGDELSYNAGILAFAVAGLKEAQGDAQGAYDVLLRCWRFDAARENRFYHRCLAPDLVRLALALGDRDVAAEVAARRRGRRSAGAGGADGAQPGAAVPGTGGRRGRADDRGGRARPPGAAPGRARRRVRGRGDAAGPGRAARRGGGPAGGGARTLRAGGRRCLGTPGPHAAASSRRPSGPARIAGPAGARLGEPHQRPSGRCRGWWPRD